MKLLAHLLLAGFPITAAIAAEPDAAKVHAWYRTEGIQAEGINVFAWKNAATEGTKQSLTRDAGAPRAFRVSTPGGTRTVVRFDGKSALWQPANDWGALEGERTVVVFMRILPKGAGFLFDGSTKSGSAPARLVGGKWKTTAKATSPPKPGEWQVQTFVFAKDAPPLRGFIIGGNVATRDGLACDVAELLVYDRALPKAELDETAAYLRTKWGEPADLRAAEQPKAASLPDDPRLFRKTLRQQGDDGVKSCRIPGLTTSAKGTLLAVFDFRHNGAGDQPANIDVGLMRSTDDGATWSAMQPIIDFNKNEPGARGNGVGDPAILADQKTGAIFVAATWSKGNRAWHGSGPGLTPEEAGQLVIVKSTDDGVTWSKPLNITAQVKDPAWHYCLDGPGKGIQLRDGTLVFAAQLRDADKVPHSCFIASTDGGETWEILPAAILGNPPTSESQIAELDDGSLLLSMRNEARGGKRAWARWEWKGRLMHGKWSEPWLTVPDPTCMASLIRHPQGELLLSNPDSASKRVAMTVRTSTDDGKTWSAGRLLDPRLSAYSCMTVLKDGRIGILYECGERDAAAQLEFARFPLEWVLGK